MEQKRLDLELVERELVRSRTRAQQAISQQLVLVNGIPVSKPSLLVSATDSFELLADAESQQLASRAGEKLAGVLKSLPTDAFPIAGKVFADIGASTGGFTDVLLRADAKKVYAIDVGTDQLLDYLKTDPRVVNMEQCNARQLDENSLPEKVSGIVADVSFVSLNLLLPAITSLLAVSGRMLLMVKPQFEVGKNQLGKGGVVSNPQLHEDAVHRVVLSAVAEGGQLIAVSPSPLLGPNGNREFFILLNFEEANGDGSESKMLPATSPLPGSYLAAIEKAVAWQPSTVTNLPFRGTENTVDKLETPVFWV